MFDTIYSGEEDEESKNAGGDLKVEEDNELSALDYDMSPSHIVET